jgi:hypothetical protein
MPVTGYIADDRSVGKNNIVIGSINCISETGKIFRRWFSVDLYTNQTYKKSGE